MGQLKQPSAFYRFRLKWMPFANLTVIAVGIFIILQLPYLHVHILEPAETPASSRVEVGSSFNLRVFIEESLGCGYEPSSLRVVAKPTQGEEILIGNLVQDYKHWVASNINLPWGEYQLTVSVQADCEEQAVTDTLNIAVVCKPLTVAQAKLQGDLCGEYVSDNCGGYVKLPSCSDFGNKDPRLNNPNLNCKQTGYYVGKSALTYEADGKTHYYFAALKCDSENDTECYKSTSNTGSCITSKTPEAFDFYGSKEDPAFHKCRIECSQ